MAIRLLTGNLYAIDQSCIYHLLAFRILFLQHNNHHKILVTAYTYLHMRTACILTSVYTHTYSIKLYAACLLEKIYTIVVTTHT